MNGPLGKIFLFAPTQDLKWNNPNIAPNVFVVVFVPLFRTDSDPVVLHFSTCDNIQYITSLYLSLVCLLIFGLTFGIIGTILGCVATLCMHHCQPKVKVKFALL